MSSENLATEKSSTVIENELPPVGELLLGRVHTIDTVGKAVVSFLVNNKSYIYSAQSTQSITEKDLGRQVALMFIDGKIDKPLLIGFIYSPLDDIISNYSFQSEENKTDELVFDEEISDPAPIEKPSQTVKVDGKRVVIEGDDEVVLKCGEASITLTKSGKVMIRGKYILNRSSGVNRILGGSVQVN